MSATSRNSGHLLSHLRTPSRPRSGRHGLFISKEELFSSCILVTNRIFGPSVIFICYSPKSSSHPATSSYTISNELINISGTVHNYQLDRINLLK